MAQRRSLQPTLHLAGLMPCSEFLNFIGGEGGAGRVAYDERFSVDGANKFSVFFLSVKKETQEDSKPVATAPFVTPKKVGT